MIRFVCSKCGHKINVADKHAGKKGKCPKCGNVVIVPQKSTMIEFHCESCGQKITVPQKYAGKKGTCPKCKNAIVVPADKRVPAEGAKTVRFTCPMCDQSIDMPESSRGKLIECPHCSSYVEVPPEKPAEEKPKVPVEPAKEQAAPQRRYQAPAAPMTKNKRKHMIEMKKFAKHNKQSKILAIALMLTGAIGLWSIGLLLTNVSNVGKTLSSVTLGICLALFGVFTGIGLWKQYSSAFTAAIVYFLLQVIGIKSSVISYEMYSGFRLTITLGSRDTLLMINVFALAMLIFTLHVRKDIERQARTSPGVRNNF